MLNVGPNLVERHLEVVLRDEFIVTLFVDMAELVSQHVAAAHFMMVGDGPERPAIERRVAELGLQDRVHFTGTRSDIPRLLAAFNVFCLTSDNEANPVSILEALSTQVPVVATDVGSVAASVRPNETGFLVPPGKPAPFAEAVIKALQYPQLSQGFGATDATMWCNRHLWKKWYKGTDS